MEVFGKISAWFLGIVLSILVSGLFVYHFWGWFIAPCFEVDVVTYSQAVGIALFLSLIQPKASNAEHKSIGAIILYQFIVCFAQIAILLIGWIVSLFIL